MKEEIPKAMTEKIQPIMSGITMQGTDDSGGKQPKKQQNTALRLVIILTVCVFALLVVLFIVLNYATDRDDTAKCNSLRSIMYKITQAVGNDYTNISASYECQLGDFINGQYYFGDLSFESTTDMRSQKDIEQHIESQLTAIGSGEFTRVSVSRLNIVKIHIDVNIVNAKYSFPRYVKGEPLISEFETRETSLLVSNDQSYLSYTFGYIPSGDNLVEDKPEPDGRNITSTLYIGYHTKPSIATPTAELQLKVIAIAGDMSSSTFDGSACLTPPIKSECVKIGTTSSGEEVYKYPSTNLITYTVKNKDNYILLLNNLVDKKYGANAVTDQEIVRILSNVKQR